VLFTIHKLVHSATTKHQYIVSNTQLWLHVSVSSNHLQAIIYYMKVIQCVRTLWDTILFTLIKAKIIPLLKKI